MKNLIVLLVSVFTLSTYHASATNNEEPTLSYLADTPQKCQFSLSSYTGTIYEAGDGSYITNNFKVSLSCPVDKEVSATVFVYVEGELVASKVVSIPAGKKSSEDTNIRVSSDYEGKKYKLTVE